MGWCWSVMMGGTVVMGVVHGFKWHRATCTWGPAQFKIFLYLKSSEFFEIQNKGLSVVKKL
jgi:hypothetical protein